MTFLGVATASSQIAVQIVETAISIVDFFKKLKDAPELVRKQNAHVEQLIDIARLIAQNTSLQTDVTARILGSCLQAVEELQGRLKKGTSNSADGTPAKIYKALLSTMNGKNVQTILSQLERDKSSLMLCIQEIDS